MFRQIMVPLDGSETAEAALPYAEQIAASSGGTLHLVRVVGLPAAVRFQGVGAPVNVYEQIIADQRQEAAAYLQRVRSRVEADGRSVHVKRLDGDEATALLDYARDAGIDLMVITTHGHTGILRWALGSVADRIVHGGALPVLLVPVQPARRT